MTDGDSGGAARSPAFGVPRKDQAPHAARDPPAGAAARRQRAPAGKDQRRARGWAPGCAALALAALASLGAVPAPRGTAAPDAAKLWWSIAMQLLDFRPTSHRAPPLARDGASRDERLRRPATSPSSLQPLPDDFSADQDDWQMRLRQAFPARPVVVRRLMLREGHRFSGVMALNKERLNRAYNGTQVGVFTDFLLDKSVVDMDFNAYTEQMTNNSRMLYARAIADVDNTMTGSVPYDWIASVIDLGFTRVFTKAIGQRDGCCVLFVGSNHTFSNAHCDIGTSVFLQVQGRKRWVFYSPKETLWLYPGGQPKNAAFNVGLDVFRPDLAKAPLFEHARGYELILEPGDVLFFPSMWWHGVENLDQVTVGIDVPFWDVAGSWQRNSVLTAATVLNPHLIWNMIRGMVQGLSIREVFFMGYHAD